MKKFMLLVIAIISLSCNSDDGTLEECTSRVWSMVKNCNPDDETDCVYIATFGEDEQTAGSIFTNETTYNYYTSRGNTSDGTVCWEGTKD